MSGARALASARRRRASPGNDNENKVVSSNGNLPVPPPYNPSIDPSPPKKINPGAMLLSHDQVLNNLQEIVSNLNGAVEEQSDKIDNLKVDDSSVEFYKEKLTTIEKQMKEIKQHVLKVQTFAMETNLQFIEMKKLLKQKSISNEEQLKKSNEISELLISE